jgi:hypothetical protein
VKKEEVESKIAAWQIAETAKIDNRFKREEVVINGWEGDQVEKASAWLKKYEVGNFTPSPNNQNSQTKNALLPFKFIRLNPPTTPFLTDRH